MTQHAIETGLELGASEPLAGVPKYRRIRLASGIRTRYGLRPNKKQWTMRPI